MTDSTEERTSKTGDDTFTIEGWMAYLWAEVTRNEDEVFRVDDASRETAPTSQLAPPVLAYHIARKVSVMGIEQVEEVVPEEINWETGVYWGKQTLQFHRPLQVGETYQAQSAEIVDVERKQGDSGEFDVVTQTYEIVTENGEPAFDSSLTAIVMVD